MKKCSNYLIALIVVIGVIVFMICVAPKIIYGICSHKKGKMYDAENHFSIQFNENKILNNTGLRIKFLSTLHNEIGNLWYCFIDEKGKLCTETPKTDKEKEKKAELDKKIQEDTRNIAIYFALTKAGYDTNLKISHEYFLHTGEKIDDDKYKFTYYQYQNITNKTRKCNKEGCFNITEHFIKDQKIEPKINIEYTDNPDDPFRGNSSGLMWALYLYSQISNEKLGEKYSHIAGTGSLHSSGDIGGVGGVTAKVEEAYAQNVDVVFVPKLPALDKSKKSNCEEAHSVPKDENVKTQIVCVNHFDEVLDYLKK